MLDDVFLRISARPWCSASCTNFCKKPSEAFFKEAFGVDAWFAPNHEDGSCTMTFGAGAYIRPLLSSTCFVLTQKYTRKTL